MMQNRKHFITIVIWITVAALMFSAGVTAVASDTNMANDKVIIDPISGRTYHCVTLPASGAPTGFTNWERPYFTQNHWCKDGVRFVARSRVGTDTGWLFEYNTQTNQYRRLVKAGANFYMVNDHLYYVDSAQKSIRYLDMNNYETTKVADFPQSGVNTNTPIGTLRGEPGMLHVTNDESKLSAEWGEGDQAIDYAWSADSNNGAGGYTWRNRRIPILDIKTGQWDTRFSHEFDQPYPLLTHVMINPVYHNLVFFCHEGTTQYIPDRLWRLDTATGEQRNIFKQHSLANGMTGEPSGHESWTADGEHLVFVKYTRNSNLGQSGIVRMEKDGSNVEYINGDYAYWHCSANADNRWIVADTQEPLEDDPTLQNAPGIKSGMTDIVMIDSKTSKSYSVARVKIGGTHPWQPHPAFSPDGTKISWQMVDETGALAIGWMDVADMVQSNEPPEPALSATNEASGFTITKLLKITDGDNTGFQLTASHLDGAEKDLIFVAAAYAADGTLQAVDMQKKTLERPSSIQSESSCEFETTPLSVSVGGTAACYLWDGAMQPYAIKPQAPANLRVRRAAGQSAILTWQPAKNRADVQQYRIYRNGELIDTVSHRYYHDSNAGIQQTNLYQVIAVYPDGESSPAASVTIQTPPSSGYSTLTDPPEENGLAFFVQESKTADSYTEIARDIGPDGDKRDCRVSTEQPPEVTGTKTKTGKFYFRVDRDRFPRDERNVQIEITYFDQGTGEIQLEYNAVSSFAKRKKLAVRTNSGEWKTAKLILDDTDFHKPASLSSSDFRIEGGAGTYLYSVVLTNLSTGTVAYQQAETVLGEQSEEHGLTLYLSDSGDGATSIANKGGRSCRIAETGKYFYFDIADDYLTGRIRQEATIRLSYFDEGTGTVQIQYNSCEPENTEVPTFHPAYKRAIVITKTGTNTWKTVDLPLIDAAFQNAQDKPYFSDFRIYSDDTVGLALDYVSVVCGI